MEKRTYFLIGGAIVGIFAICIVVAYFATNSFRGDIDRHEMDTVLTSNSVLALRIKDYLKEFGELPGKDIRSISNSLHGDNPQGKVFLNESTFNEDGLIIDRWGGVLDIRFENETIIITSPGKNGIMGDEDDKQVRHAFDPPSANTPSR
jgi:hypothetical protein